VRGINFYLEKRINMASHVLLKSQKNTILRLIQNWELEPINFSWSYTEDRLDPVPQLFYLNTGYYFIFDLNKDRHQCTFSPSKDKLTQTNLSNDWVTQLAYFKQWLKYLKHEISEPDLWDELNKYQLKDSIFDESYNQSFTVSEYEQIKTGLNNVRNYINNFKLANELQMETINNKIDYLIDGASRQGRTDWVHTCIGIIMSIAVTLSLDLEQTNEIWSIIKTSIKGVINFLPSPITTIS
jgi:hypothetical protein